MQEADRDVGPALHAAGVGVDPVVGPVGQAHHVEDLVEPVGELLPLQPLQAAEEPQVVAGGEVLVEGEVLGHEADLGLGLDGVAHHRVSGDGDVAGVGREQPADHRDRGGLARPVGAEEAVGLADPDGERHAVHGRPIAEALDQARAVEDGFHG